MYCQVDSRASFFRLGALLITYAIFIRLSRIKVCITFPFSEISTTEIRGAIMSSAAIAATAGIPIAYIIGSFCSWQMTALIGSFFPTIGIVIFVFIVNKDSPVYLMTQGLKEDCLETLQWYRQDNDDHETLEEYKSLEKSNLPRTSSGQDHDVSLQSKCKSKLRTFAKQENLMPFTIVISLLFLVPMTGIYRYVKIMAKMCHFYVHSI